MWGKIMKNIEMDKLDTLAGDIVAISAQLPENGIGMFARVHAGMIVLTALETINTNQNEDPFLKLFSALSSAKEVVNSISTIIPEMVSASNEIFSVFDGREHAIDLFENAWTTYSQDTYEHSISLVMKRLVANGFDENFFKGKTCFDGGCGTGRLSIAMARMGAEKVTAVDLGTDSLNYFKDIVSNEQIKNIEIVKHDVTNLSPWDDETYDFVASNGVLHHTDNPLVGLDEHYRLTKRGGVFWLYLYGAGGIYWHLYDVLKPIFNNIKPKTIRTILNAYSIRQGLIYTFLDNFLAPRKYFYLQDVLNHFERLGRYAWRHAKGMSEIDDTEILLQTKYGPEIYGPDGEIRIIITKNE